MHALPAHPRVSPADRLGATTFLAVLAHLILILGVTFVPEDRPERRVERLDVVLVPPSTEPVPDQPDYLAQANRDGGGDDPGKTRPERSRGAPPPAGRQSVQPGSRPCTMKPRAEEKEETVTDAWRRLAIGLAMLAPALQPASVGAQGIALSLEDLSQAGHLQAGDGVIVTDVNRRRVKADVVGLSSDVLTVTDGRSEREFAEAGILKIDRQDSLMNGALLGLIGGALAASRVDLSSDDASATASGIVLFFGGGLLVGVLVDSSIHETVYEGPGWRWAFRPLLTKGGMGARMSVGW